MMGFVVMDETCAIRAITSELELACAIAADLETYGHKCRIEFFHDGGTQ